MSTGATLVFLFVAAAAPAGPAHDATALIARAGCRECHNPEGVASDTRFVLPEPGASDRQVREFAEDLLDLVDPADPERSRLIRKPTGRMDHAGGEKVVPGSADEVVLRAWVLRLARVHDIKAAAEVLGSGGQPAVAGRAAFRRLSAAQYDNTVRDLLGDVTGPARHLPPEDFVDGFKNQVVAQGSSPILIEAYNTAAQQVADNAVRAIKAGDPQRRLPCKPSARGKTATVCRDRFVRELGRRAFRRPLSPAEVARYTALAAREKDVPEGARVVIETMLQSPSFLYLRETQDPGLRPYARASRLAYFLWNTMPDETLLGAAARGELDAPEDVERTARTMLESPKAIRAVDEFVTQWLRFDRVLSAFKDRRAFPQFSREVAVAMAEETRRLVEDLVWNDRSFLGLFTADYTFANPELAALYGLPAPDGEFAKVRYTPGSERTGVFGHGAFLAGTSKPLETSPTARGLFVRERLLCQKVPAPPPGVSMNLPPLAGEKPMTNRGRMARHLTTESCAGCHRLVDTIGYGFERFDAIGRRQEETAGELDLDTSGSILGVANSEFSSPEQIGAILAASVPAQECVAKQVFRYATGRLEGPGDRPIIERAFEEWKRAGFRFKELLVSIAKWTELG